MTLELLALPPPPKKVRGWTLRQITPLAYSISKLTYPPSVGIGVDTPMNLLQSVGQNQLAQQGWPPLKVTYSLPSNVVIRNLPIVAWWDEVTICNVLF
jgi:cancer susceptibility candidate protein 1